MKNQLKNLRNTSSIEAEMVLYVDWDMSAQSVLGKVARKVLTAECGSCNGHGEVLFPWGWHKCPTCKGLGFVPK